MPRRIPEEKIEEIRKLYEQNMPKTEIVRITGVNRGTVCRITKAWETINLETKTNVDWYSSSVESAGVPNSEGIPDEDIIMARRRVDPQIEKTRATPEQIEAWIKKTYKPLANSNHPINEPDKSKIAEPYKSSKDHQHNNNRNDERANYQDGNLSKAMPRRIPEEKIEEIRTLYEQDVPKPEIARLTGVNRSTVYKTIKAFETINPKTGEPFNSWAKLQIYEIKQRIDPETGKQFASSGKYNAYLIANRINPKTGEPFESKTEYERYMAKQRINPQKRERFADSSETVSKMALTSLVKERLEYVRIKGERLGYLDINEKWLKERLCASLRIINQCTNGEASSSLDVLEKLARTLEIHPYALPIFTFGNEISGKGLMPLLKGAIKERLKRERLNHHRIKPGDFLEDIVLAGREIKSELIFDSGIVTFFGGKKEYGRAYPQCELQLTKNSKILMGYVFNFEAGKDVKDFIKDETILDKIERREVYKGMDSQKVMNAFRIFNRSNQKERVMASKNEWEFDEEDDTEW